MTQLLTLIEFKSFRLRLPAKYYPGTSLIEEVCRTVQFALEAIKRRYFFIMRWDFELETWKYSDLYFAIGFLTKSQSTQHVLIVKLMVKNWLIKLSWISNFKDRLQLIINFHEFTPMRKVWILSENDFLLLQLFVQIRPAWSGRHVLTYTPVTNLTHNLMSKLQGNFTTWCKINNEKRYFSYISILHCYLFLYYSLM